MAEQGGARHGKNAPKRTSDQPAVYQSFAGCYLVIMSATPSVLLDLDGTLINSHPGILASCLAMLRALGHRPDEALDVKRFIGPPLEDVVRFLLQSYGDDRVDEAVVAYRQHYGESGLLRSELRELATLFGKCEKPDCEFISPRQSAKRSHVASCSTSN